MGNWKKFLKVAVQWKEQLLSKLQRAIRVKGGSIQKKNENLQEITE
jgi:hypothetical protein